MSKYDGLSSIESIGRAMAEMDGNSKQWDLEKETDMDWDDKNFDGRYLGYNAEANRIIERLSDSGFEIVKKNEAPC